MSSAKYQGFHKIITSDKFIKSLGVVYYALVQLSTFSVLQRREMTIPYAHKCVQCNLGMEFLVWNPGC